MHSLRLVKVWQYRLEVTVSPLPRNSHKITPSESKKTVTIVLPLDPVILPFKGLSCPLANQEDDSLLVSGSNRGTHVSSPVIMDFMNFSGSSFSHKSLMLSSATVIRVHFYSSVRMRGTNLAHFRVNCKSFLSIWCIENVDISHLSASSLTLRCASSANKSLTS